jgi:type II secretory ATPase GspE/PulE/Tfp pilus assembly ATPase PilB-like protein
MTAPRDAFRDRLGRLDAKSPRHAVEVVDLVLAEARAAGASDVHLQPSPDGLVMRWRIDGVMQDLGTLPAAIAPNVVARLKVMAELLTYKVDVPQEGRVRGVGGEGEVRVSTFPTLHGEKAVVRLFAASGRLLRLADLGLPDEVRDKLARLLGETSGAIVISGPAGSGKTTTAYACLRELAEATGGTRSLVSLEDPIEGAVPGVSQSQVNLAAGFDLATGLRSLMRQDPEVILVGEVRDRPTAEIAVQASLTGHLLLTTFHAGSASGAIGRLLDMGIEPYLVRSGLLAVASQRLARALCDCAVWAEDPKGRLGLAVERYRMPVGCDACRGTGYRGRIVLVELLDPEASGLGPAILERSDVRRLNALARAAGMVGRWERARAAVAEGRTSPAEIRRVFGFSDDPLDIPGQKS